MNIAIINYEAGNIGSIKYALEQCGFNCYVASTPSELETAERIILPGVGSFNMAMQSLSARQLDIAIKQAVTERKVPILGICLGFQLFATTGYEGGVTEGLNLIPGEVRPLRSSLKDLRLPHVGWNEIHLKRNHKIFANIPSGSDYYFAHSYHFVSKSDDWNIADTEYGLTFHSVVIKDNVVGIQFHPEKSGLLGKQILKNFILS